jgi:hypothetical protein
VADEKITVQFELSGVDKAKVEVAEFEKGLTSAQKAVVALAKADETSGAALKALEDGLAAGTVSAEEYVAALKKIADQAPKTATQVKAAAAAEERAAKTTAAEADKAAKAAEKAAAASAKKAEAAKKAAEEEALAALAAAEAVAKAEEEKTRAAQKHADDVRRINEAAARDARSSRPGLAESLEARGVTAGGLVGATGAALGATAAFTAATLAAANAGAIAAGRSERHQRALAGLGNTYRLVQAATNDTLSAEDAYRAQLDLTRSGLRVSGEEFALITRYAREHKGALETNEEALQQLTEALRNGEAEGLRKFGISTKTGATRAQQFERAIRQMDRATKDAAPAQRTLAEEQERASRAFGEGVDSLGRLAAHALGLPETMSQVADAIRDVVGAVEDMIAAEQRLPAQRALQERRQRAQASYGQALRAAGTQLDALGVDRALLPSADAANRLTPEQLEAADARLRNLVSRVGNRELNPAAGGEFGAGARFVPGRARSTGEGADFGALTRAPDLAALDAEAQAFQAGQRARRGERRGGAFARAAAARAEAEAALRGLSAELAREAAANQTRPTRPPPRDTASTATGGPAKNVLGILMEQAVGGAQGVGAGDLGSELRRIGAIGPREANLNPNLGADLYTGPARRPGGGQGAAGDAADESLAARAQARSRRALEQQLDAEQSYTDRMRDMHGERASLAQSEAEAVTMGFASMGKALGTHVNAVVAGRETLAFAAQAMVSDTLVALGQEAVAKGAMQIAEGLAMLAGIYTAPLAPMHFAAGAAFMGVGALVGAAGAAIAPAPASAAGAAPSAPSAPVGALGSANDNERGGPTEITINLGGGVVMGSARELGEALGRVINDPSGGVSINPQRVRRAGRAA